MDVNPDELREILENSARYRTFAVSMFHAIIGGLTTNADACIHCNGKRLRKGYRFGGQPWVIEIEEGGLRRVEEFADFDEAVKRLFE